MLVICKDCDHQVRGANPTEAVLKMIEHDKENH